MPSKLIVLYGINNLGKTTQAKMLVERLNAAGFPAEYLKYPVYSLEPSGKLINDYLRQGNPHQLTPREFQILQVVNRYQYQPKLLKKMEACVNIVAEDYKGTGLAWGIGAGVNEQFLKQLNNDLLKEDIAFLFQGERFRQSIENGHTHESDDKLMEKVRAAHDRLGLEYGWKLIDANLPIETISEKIWQIVQSKLK